MTQVTIWPHGTPQPKGSVSAFYDKARHQMRRFDSNRKGKAWAAEVRDCAEKALLGWDENLPTPLHGPGVPVAVVATFFLPKPKKPKWKIYPLGKPDVDKLVRGLLDPLIGVLFADDSQVVMVSADKQWASPGMEGAIVTVQPLGLHASAQPATLGTYDEAEGAVGI